MRTMRWAAIFALIPGESQCCACFHGFTRTSTKNGFRTKRDLQMMDSGASAWTGLMSDETGV